MQNISELLDVKPEGTKSFPIYRVNKLDQGKVFAEASMGFLSKIEYGITGDEITVKVSTQKPVLSTLGCQLAGWGIDDAMISGPLRMKVKKPGFVFDKIKFGRLPDLPNIACLEGDVTETTLINELKLRGIESADVLWTDENSDVQYINILARAIEIAIFRLSFLTDLNDLRIDKAMSTVTTTMNKEDLNCELNDAIRFNGKVTLIGDFSGFRDFEPIVTKNAGLSDQRFKTVMQEQGSIAKCPLEIFSVDQLTVIDSGKTRVF